MQHVFRIKSNRLQKFMKLNNQRQKNNLFCASLYIPEEPPCESESEVLGVGVYFELYDMYHFIYSIWLGHQETYFADFCPLLKIFEIFCRDIVNHLSVNYL